MSGKTWESEWLIYGVNSKEWQIDFKTARKCRIQTMNMGNAEGPTERRTSVAVVLSRLVQHCLMSSNSRMKIFSLFSWFWTKKSSVFTATPLFPKFFHWIVPFWLLNWFFVHSEMLEPTQPHSIKQSKEPIARKRNEIQANMSTDSTPEVSHILFPTYCLLLVHCVTLDALKAKTSWRWKSGQIIIKWF